MILDLFAGPGGWDVGARELGLLPLGIEWDDSACKTRNAAGLSTRKGDVSQLQPGYFGPVVDGIIASPPCQAWSQAGSRGGERDKALVYSCLQALARGDDSRDQYAEACEDPRSLLVVEPLRWTLALEPTWLAWEQVEPVLELWRWHEEVLRVLGYSVWTGVLSAERYGVPQVRRRAFLMAHRDRPVAPPAPTHQAFVPGEPARHEFTLEGELLPWVSMADALGWGMTARPYPVIASSRSTGGPDKEKVGGSGARDAIYEEQAAGRWVLKAGNQEGATRRGLDEPAPTQAFGKNAAAHEWVLERPATTIQGDSRVWPPGHKINAEDLAAGRDDYEGRAGKNAVRVTHEEAAVLQGFPADYPFQGNKSQRFQQIGNAVPPALGRAVLAQLADPVELEEAA